MRGDINAVELYQDRKFRTMVGMGIYDVSVGSTGDVGFEDVYRYSYIDKEEQDEKYFRRRVFKLTGRYYHNELAKALWQQFIKYHAELEFHGQRLNLSEAAREWLAQYGHEFIKNWILEQAEVSFRLRNQAELQLGWLEVAVYQIAPSWRELIANGFHTGSIVFSTLAERFLGKTTGEAHYLRVVARLAGLPVRNKAELEQHRQELSQFEESFCRHTGCKASRKAVILEYFRRLQLLAEIEGPHAVPSNLTPATC
jgi:hypothetical protein